MVTPDTLRDMWDFFQNEYQYYELYPSIYEAIPEKRTPQPRSKNTLIDCFSRIRTFFLWCFDNKRTTNRPFDKFPIEECTYGTPYYITLEERDRIFNADLSATPQLAIQRDIFIFQTLIGCRVSDLYRMTKLNVVNEAIEYIPKKTKYVLPSGCLPLHKSVVWFRCASTDLRLLRCGQLQPTWISFLWRHCTFVRIWTAIVSPHILCSVQGFLSLCR